MPATHKNFENTTLNLLGGTSEYKNNLTTPGECKILHSDVFKESGVSLPVHYCCNWLRPYIPEAGKLLTVPHTFSLLHTLFTY
jgi:hypothetical protein